VEKTLNALINGITSILQTEGKLTLAGLGTFSVNERQERQGRNPQTGKPIKIAAARVVKFKPGEGSGQVIFRGG